MAAAVILTGFMGSGKSAVGRRLAQALDYDFFDADPLTEEEMGMSITEAFAREGEAYFRASEEKVVLRLLDEAGAATRGRIVALGGGAVTIPAVAGRLRAEPLVFLLDQDVETAFERAQRGPRPLARDREAFGALFAEREDLYHSVAGFVVDARGRDADAVAGQIVRLLEERDGQN